MVDMTTTEYHESSFTRRDGPFGGEMIRATGALCPDGKRRNAHPSHDGVADTFFSIPAFVYVGSTRVYGYVTFETMAGFTTETPDDPTTVKFRPYTYRKNHGLVEQKCRRCGVPLTPIKVPNDPRIGHAGELRCPDQTCVFFNNPQNRTDAA